jgi:hypothetical protein
MKCTLVPLFLSRRQCVFFFFLLFSQMNLKIELPWWHNDVDGCFFPSTVFTKHNTSSIYLKRMKNRQQYTLAWQPVLKRRKRGFGDFIVQFHIYWWAFLRKPYLSGSKRTGNVNAWNVEDGKLFNSLHWMVTWDETNATDLLCKSTCWANIKSS